MLAEPIYRPGLEGVIAAKTRLSHIDGQAGQLTIAGFPLEEIALNATFEEMLYLLWHDTLPDAAQLQQFSDALRAQRTLSAGAEDVLRRAAERKLPVMDAMRLAAGLLNLSVDAGDTNAASLSAVASLPVITAAYWRLLHGEAVIPPDESLGQAANYLYMLEGHQPDAARVRALETYLNTVMEHGFNASTFTARVIISTGSDVISAVVGAIGAMKGPLHGGAPGPALDMVFEIGTPERAEPVIRERLARGERLMGFGHRVYKVRDPRADVLNTAASRFFEQDDQRELYDLVRHVEQVALRLLAEYKPERRLQTNVEYYTALILHGVGLDTALFTPTFSVARAGGWTAHIREHLENGRILRPIAEYTGAFDRRWQPLSKR